MPRVIDAQIYSVNTLFMIDIEIPKWFFLLPYSNIIHKNRITLCYRVMTPVYDNIKRDSGKKIKITCSITLNCIRIFYNFFTMLKITIYSIEWFSYFPLWTKRSSVKIIDAETVFFQATTILIISIIIISKVAHSYSRRKKINWKLFKQQALNKFLSLSSVW